MNTTNAKLRHNFIIASEAVIFLLQLLGLILVWTKYTSYNALFYYVIVVFAMLNLFSEKRHYISAFLWSLMTMFVLGCFFGVAAVALYWVLYFMQVKYASRTKKTAKQCKTDKADKNGKNDNNYIPDFISKNGYELLQTIQPIMRIPFFGIPAFWHKYYVVKRGKTYLLLNRPFFFFFTKTTDLCSLHRPDLVKEWLQIFNMAEVVIFSDEDKSRLMKIWVSRKDGLPLIADLIENITSACKANEVKRIVGETAPHTGKKK